MSHLSPLWILGSDDAEMTAIERLLHQSDQQVVYACNGRGQRVIPGQHAVGVIVGGEPRFAVGDNGASTVGAIAIEVAGPWGQPQIDHHDGSERASWGPELFLAASSIGQVIERLAQMGALPDSWARRFVRAYDEFGRTISTPGHFTQQLQPHGWLVYTGPTEVATIPQALVFEAAADHCPAAAIAGLCPGVDPVTFATFLAESKRRQYFPWMSPEDFAQELEISRATLRMAPSCAALDTLVQTQIQGPGGDWYDAGMQPAGYIRDLRHLEPGTVPAQGSGECYPAEFLVGIVAAIFEGVGFVCRIRRRDGRLALRSNGHGQGTAAGTRPAEVFLADPGAFGCGPTQPPGQDASYGNPIRGFFGGTLIDQG